MKFTEQYTSELDLQKATAEGVAVVADIVGTCGPRPSGSEQELKAQKMLADKVRPYASKVDTEPFEVHRQAFMGFIPFTVACGVASVFVNWYWSPIAALILCILAFIPLFFEFLRYDEFNDFLFPKQTSHNTYAVIPPAGETKQRIVMVSHSDSQYEWTLNWLFGQIKGIGDKGGLVAKLAGNNLWLGERQAVAQLKNALDVVADERADALPGKPVLAAEQIVIIFELIGHGSSSCGMVTPQRGAA